MRRLALFSRASRRSGSSVTASLAAGGIGLGLLVAGLVASCADTRPQVDPEPPANLCACEPGGGPVVDPVLFAFLSKARAAHHEADIAEEAKDRAAAIRALDRLVKGPQPGSGPLAPEAQEVLADTRARLADLKSAEGDFDAASRDIEAGLRLAATPTHFRGHLIEIRGVLEERRSAALKEKGDLPGAEAAKQAAVKSFEEAIEVQDEVILRALGDAGAP
jgi:tetratricopeptide (TPR) repeat protein